MNSKQNQYEIDKGESIQITTKLSIINDLYSEIRELKRQNDIELERAIHYRAEWQDSQARIRELEKKLADIAAIIKG